MVSRCAGAHCMMDIHLWCLEAGEHDLGCHTRRDGWKDQSTHVCSLSLAVFSKELAKVVDM